MARVVCSSLVGGTTTSTSREVTMVMESVVAETWTRTGYGRALLTVTGIFAVSLTTFRLSMGVILTASDRVSAMV